MHVPCPLYVQHALPISASFIWSDSTHSDAVVFLNKSHQYYDNFRFITQQINTPHQFTVKFYYWLLFLQCVIFLALFILTHVSKTQWKFIKGYEFPVKVIIFAVITLPMYTTNMESPTLITSPRIHQLGS